MKLNNKRTFYIGFAFMSICAFWQLYDNIIPLILSETFGINDALTGGIMAVDNVLALFLLPIMGSLSDKVRSPLGKRTPFIAVGTFFSVILMGLMSFADNKQNFILFFLSLGLALVSMASYRSPAVALMPDLTPKPLRSKANAIINLMGTLGGIYTLLMIKFLVNKEGKANYFPLFISVAILMIAAVILLIFTINENKLSKEIHLLDNQHDIEDILTSNGASSINKETASPTLPKEIKRSLIFLLASVFLWFTAYNAVTTAFSRYAVNVWNLPGGDFTAPLLVATAAATISYIPIGFLSTKFGRKKTIIAGIIIMTISYICGFMIIDYSSIMLAILALTGIGWAAINVNSYPMVVEMSNGGDVGKYTGIYYTFSMSAQIITPILSGFLLEYVSYRTLFPYAVVFSLLSLTTMLMVKQGNTNVPKKSVIENFDLDD